MNSLDAPMLPILTAMNLHPLHRRQGTLVARAEVLEALSDLGLDGGPIPKGRLIDAAEVEKLLAEYNISPELVKHRVVHHVLFSATPNPKR
jgi:hypothetical protein